MNKQFLRSLPFPLESPDLSGGGEVQIINI